MEVNWSSMAGFEGILLVSDLDGTLLNRDGDITKENYEAIVSFMAGGGYFTVATGRSLQSFGLLRGNIPTNAPIILSGGPLIFDFDTETPLRMISLSKGYIQLCQAALSAFPDVAAEAHLLDGIWGLGENELSILHQNIVKTRVTAANTPSDIPDGWLKALFIAPHDRLVALQDWMLPHCQGKFELVFSHPLLLELQDARADKGESASWLAWHLDIPQKNVFCAGDYQNDLSMLKRFRAFAPKSAQPEVIASVRRIGPGCDDHFIAWVVSQLAQSP